MFLYMCMCCIYVLIYANICMRVFIRIYQTTVWTYHSQETYVWLWYDVQIIVTTGRLYDAYSFSDMLMIQCYPWKTFRRIVCGPCFNIKMPYYLVMPGIPLASSRPSAGGRPTLHSHRPGTGRSSAGRRAAIWRLLLSFRCLPGRRTMSPTAGRRPAGRRGMFSRWLKSLPTPGRF